MKGTRRAWLGLLALLGVLVLGVPAAGQEAARVLPPAPESVLDEAVRAAMRKLPDGTVARAKTAYNEIVIAKQRNELAMMFRLDGRDYTESASNLADPDDLPVHYTRTMTTALAYPPAIGRVLMIGLGGGSIPAYLGRAMPELAIDTVEIDAGVIDAAKRFFGLRETARLKLIEGDGRAFVRETENRYDVIFVDAYFGGSVPGPLQTQEFFALLKAKLTPGGVACFNVHDGNTLYLSTIRTLQSVFAEVHLYPSGRGEVAVVASAEPASPRNTLIQRAEALQAAHRFRYPLLRMIDRRTWLPASLDRAPVLTDAGLKTTAP